MCAIWRRQASHYIQHESEQATIAQRRVSPCLPLKTEKAAYRRPLTFRSLPMYAYADELRQNEG
jgi:hypothetical protein